MDDHRGGGDFSDSPEPSARPGGADTADLARQDYANLLACVTGAPDAFAGLYERHGATCFGLASQILHDERLAQDAVQDAFVALWRGAPDFDPSRSSVRARLTMLTRRRAIELVRTERGRPRLIDLRADTPDEIDPGGAAVMSALGERVLVLLGGVPPEQRRCLVLAFWGGYTVNEIAEVTGARPRAVKTRLCAAMRRLQRQMDAPTRST